MPGSSSVNTANIVVGEAEVKVGASNTSMTNSIEKLLPGIFGASSNSPSMGAGGESLG